MFVSESLFITVKVLQKLTFHSSSIIKFELKTPYFVLADIQNTLNDDYTKIVPLVTQLRYWVVKQRVKKTLQVSGLMVTFMKITLKENFIFISSSYQPLLTNLCPLFSVNKSIY